MLVRTGYFWRTAIGGFRARPLVHFAAFLVLALALFSAFVAASASRFIETFFDTWGSQAELTVYLKPFLTAAQAEEVFRRVEASGVGEARLMTPEEALAQLKDELKEDADVLENLPKNPLTYAIEVRPNARYFSAAALEPVAAAWRAEPEVEAVDYGREWFDKFSSLAFAARRAAAVFLVFVLAAAAAVSALTLRLSAFTRQEEIALLRLVGATEAFVRAPFLLEGVLLGVLAAGAAFAALCGLEAFLLPELASRLAFLLGEPGFPPLGTGEHLAVLTAVGAVLGGAGSALSVRRQAGVG